MSKILSKEEFAAKISANRARIAEAQMLDSSLVDIDFSNRIDDVSSWEFSLLHNHFV